MGPIIEQLGLDGLTILFHAVNLVILVGGLYGLLFRPVRKMIRKRREELDAVFSENTRLNNEALEIKRKYETKLEETKHEVARISVDAIKAAEAKSAEIVAAATQKSEEMLDGAKKEIESERTRLANEYKTQVTELAVEVAETILAREVKAADNKKIIDEALSKWSG